MSPRDRSERIAVLRQAIAKLEAGEGPRLAAPHVPATDERRGRQRTVRLGRDECQAPLSAFDKALGGGLVFGALHEIVAASAGDACAASGFALALAARFAMADTARTAEALLWVIEAFAARETGAPYAPGLTAHGLDPARFILVDTRKPQETLWVMEEALRARALAAVIGELWNGFSVYDLTASRRLLLAARAGGTPCLLVHAGAAGQADRLSSAADTRFEVSARPSVREPAAGGLPLPGRPAWSVRLVKARTTPGHAHDPDRRFDLVWNPEERCFCDEHVSAPLPVPVDRPTVSGDR